MKDAILSRLSPEYPWKDHFEFLSTVDSTNTRLKALAAQGAPHGTVLAADQQTGGRGRLGRTFLSPAGVGIYLSILLRPQCTPGELMHLTCASAVAMCDAIEAAAGIRPQIKWTNDLVSGKKKLAGILSELGFGPGGALDYAIVGIGVNCCQKPSDFAPEIRDTACSLSSITGRDVDRAGVAAAMMEALFRMDRDLFARKEEMLSQYRRDCVTIGQEVSLVRFDSVRHGKALDVDDEGALIVAFADGHTESVSCGEVSVRGMYGYV